MAATTNLIAEELPDTGGGGGRLGAGIGGAIVTGVHSEAVISAWIG
jgi:hypothetical protein